MIGHGERESKIETNGCCLFSEKNKQIFARSQACTLLKL